MMIASRPLAPAALSLSLLPVVCPPTSARAGAQTEDAGAQTPRLLGFGLAGRW